jgi:LuxR family transcriptional regulator, maltose regulon positive regulatory protein
MKRAGPTPGKPPTTRPTTPLVSKAKIPRPATGSALPRARLFQILDRTSSKVFWINGPPGSGKTTLASSYAEQARRPSIWLRFDLTDSDPASWFLHLTQAATDAGPVKSYPLPILAPEQLPSIAVFAQNYFRALFHLREQGLLLVLDDCHEVPDDRVIPRLWSCLLQEIPPGSLVLVLSRKEPSVHLARNSQQGGSAT